MKVRFTATARADLFAQIEWLAALAPPAARRAADQIGHQLLLLGEFPQAAPQVDEQHREATIRFGRDGFVIRYRIEADHLLVVRLFHGRQAR